MPVGPAKLLPMVVALLCGAALAQDATLPPPSPPLTPAQVDALTEVLETGDAVARMKAGETLASGLAPLRELERVLQREDLTAEQRLRLTAAAHARFLSEPRAAMGVQFQTPPGLPDVYIASTVRGFDCNSKLRPGDRLDAIDQVRLEDDKHAVAIIQSHTPGDAVAVTVERNGQLVEMTVVLGSREALGSANMLHDRAWLIRSAGYGQRLRDAEGVIDSGLSPLAWNTREVTPGPRPTRPAEGVRVVAGGEPRTLDPLTARAMEPSGRRRDTVGLQPMQVPVNPAADHLTLSKLRRDRADEQARVESFIVRLNNPNLKESQRRQLEELRDMGRVRVDGYDIQIRTLEDALRRR